MAMATTELTQTSEQARKYARAALEAFAKVPAEKRLAAIEPSRLPDAQRERFWALAYDATVTLEAQTTKPGPKVAGDQITAQAFWWGWHLSVPHSQVDHLTDSAEVIAEIVAAALEVVPEIGELVGLGVKLYAGIYSGAIHLVDSGNGVYLSQFWVNFPGPVFLPTAR
jgi:hypothetical protein